MDTSQPYNNNARTQNGSQSPCENIFETILNISHDAIIGMDQEQKIFLFNKGAQRIFGYKAEEVIGHPHTILLPPDKREVHQMHIERFNKSPETAKSMGERNEVLGMRKDGTIFPVAASIAKATYDDKTFFSVIVRDITGQKQIEQKLRSGQERLANIIESTHIGTSEWNVQTGELNINRRWAEMIGYTLEELAPISIKTLENLIHPENYDRAKELMEMHFAFGTDFYEYEYRMKHKEGHWIWILDHAKVITQTDDGKPLWVYGIHMDITERKTIEQALVDSERYLHHLLSATPTITYSLKWNGEKIVPNWTSENLTRLLGYTQKESYAPEWWRSNIHPDDLQMALAERQAIFNTEHVLQEYRFRHKDGHYIWLRDEISLFRDKHGDPLEIIGTRINITEQKLADEQIRTQLRRVESLNTIQMVMVNSFDVRLTLNAIVEAAISELNVDAALVLLLNPYTNILEFATGKGFTTRYIQEGSIKMGEGIAGHVVLERKNFYIPNLLDTEDQFVRTPFISEEGFVTYVAEPLIAKGKVKGVLEIFHRSQFKPGEQWSNYFKTIAGQAAVAIDSAQSFEELQRSNINLSLAYDNTIEGWSHAMDLRDKETEGHTRRVTELTLQLSRAMGISEAQLVHIRRGALLHDMGKLGIPDYILHKPGKLTDEEWVIMRKHPQFAYDMLSSIDYLRPALDIPYCHHEKWDGRGYPRGLKGEQIPIAARIFAVIDVWDALTSDRPYRAAWSHEKTLAYIRELSGTHFDPKVVDLFLNVMAEKEAQGDNRVAYP